MEFTETNEGLRLSCERHYTLVPKDALSDDDLQIYRAMNAES